MFLKNYTSLASVSESLARIEWVLVRCGVSGINKEYSQTVPGKILAVSFFILLGDHRLNVRLPVDESACLEALWADYCGSTSNPRRRTKTKNDFIKQAERTAWRIMKDWVEVQMSMIHLKQADTVQVFLPYVWDGQQTYYSRLKQSGFRAMLPEKTS